jgi:hypothetical protein
MHIVAAGVHDARMPRGEGEGGLFVDGECVDVSTDGDRRKSGITPTDACYDPRAGNAVELCRLERGECRMEPVGRPLLLKRELGVLVQIAAQLDERAPHGGREEPLD